MTNTGWGWRGGRDIFSLASNLGMTMKTERERGTYGLVSWKIQYQTPFYIKEVNCSDHRSIGKIPSTTNVFNMKGNKNTE